MTRLTFGERMRITGLGLDRSRRAAVSRLLASPAVRWTLGPPSADQLLIVPPDLRTADPSFWRELKLGQMGLASSTVDLGGRSPFEVPPPTEAWERALHGFGWLRHLDAVDNEEARAHARELALDWAKRRRAARTTRFDAAVRGRRLISWLSHTDLLLGGAGQRDYDTITDSLGDQLKQLSATWRDVPPGPPRLLALVALTLADLSIAGHDLHLAGAERALCAELQHQILPDGGHISRNPSVPIDLLLDLLPLRQCFASRARAIPQALDAAIQRMLPLVRMMRLGDGQTARFNGMGVAAPAAQATVLAYEDATAPIPQAAQATGYARLARGDTLLIADVGAAPPLEHAGLACAGCLSFELSVGTDLVFVNGGAPSPADAAWRPASRATASHNTIVLAEQSSSRLVRHAALEDLIGAIPIRGPDTVASSLTDAEGEQRLTASHNGYQSRFGLVHRRTLTLSADGHRLDGLDSLEGPGRTPVRLKEDVPLAVHFHLAPGVGCRHGATPEIVYLTLTGGTVLRFTSATLPVAVEESIHYADSSGPAAALQLVLRDLTSGGAEIAWSLERVAV